MELKRTNGTTATPMDNSLVYTDSYTISQLSTTDEGRVIQCEVVINASPPIMSNDSITLDVTGEYTRIATPSDSCSCVYICKSSMKWLSMSIVLCFVLTILQM